MHHGASCNLLRQGSRIIVPRPLPVCWVSSRLLSVDEILFYSMAHVPSLCLFGLLQKPKKAGAIVHRDVIPAAIAAVPLTTNSYGLAQGWCQMKNWNGDCSSDIQRAGNIELLAIGFVPLAIVLALNSTAVAVMLVILTTRACYYKRKETLLGSTGNNGTQQLKALKEILPLIAYPILLLILFMPPFITHVYNTKPHPLNEVNALLVVAALGLSAGATLIIHVIVVSYLNYQRRRKQSKILSYGSANAADHETIQVTNTSNVPSYTYFSIPVED